MAQQQESTKTDLKQAVRKLMEEQAMQYAWLMRTFEACWPDPQRQPEVIRHPDTGPEEISLVWKAGDWEHSLDVNMIERTGTLTSTRPGDPSFPTENEVKCRQPTEHNLDGPAEWASIHQKVTSAMTGLPEPSRETRDFGQQTVPDSQ